MLGFVSAAVLGLGVGSGVSVRHDHRRAVEIGIDLRKIVGSVRAQVTSSITLDLGQDTRDIVAGLSLFTYFMTGWIGACRSTEVTAHGVWVVDCSTTVNQLLIFCAGVNLVVFLKSTSC